MNNLTIEQPAGPTTTPNRFETQSAVSELIGGSVRSLLSRYGLDESEAGIALTQALGKVPVARPAESLKLVDRLDRIGKSLSAEDLDSIRDPWLKCVAIVAIDRGTRELILFFRTHRVLFLPIVEP
ncbi:MAG: hypothetical protein ACRDRT_05915, partial [Pseudonocardiaceae bacterium]